MRECEGREKHTDLDLLLEEVDFVLLLQELLLLPGNLLRDTSHRQENQSYSRRFVLQSSRNTPWR